MLNTSTGFERIDVIRAFFIIVLALTACDTTTSRSQPGQESSRMQPDAAAPDDPSPLIDDLWDYGDPAGSERRFRAALAEEAGREPPTPRALEIQTQIARALGLQRRFAAANAVLDAVHAELSPDYPPVIRVRWLLERGRVLNSAGEPRRSVSFFDRAYVLARNIHADFYAVDATHMLAIVASDPTEALRWNETALSVAAASTDPRTRDWRGSLLNNLGWAYHDAGDFANALARFEQARDFFIDKNDDRRRRIAEWTVARALRSLERYDEALAIQQRLAREYDAAGESDGYVHEELGELLLITEGALAAQPHFAEAYALLSRDPWLQANEPQRLARLKQLAGARDASPSADDPDDVRSE